MNFTHRTPKIIRIILPAFVVLATVSIPSAFAKGVFFIERPKLGLDATYEFEDEKRQTLHTETKTVRHDIRENMIIKTNGWAYHPSLLAYHLFFQPGWRQEKFKERQETPDTPQRSRQNASLLAYDVGAILLKNKPCALDLFAKRSDWHINSAQAQSSDIESETRGARLNFANRILPASIGFADSQSIQTGFYRFDENRDEMDLNIGLNVKNSITQLNLLHDETGRTTTGVANTQETTHIDSTTTNTELTNTSFFNDDHTVRLDSQLYQLQREHDDSSIRTCRVSENLFWVHSKSLETRYGFKYDRRKFDGFTVKETAIKAGLTHRLYESLTTTLGGDIAANEFSGGDENRYRSNLGFNYHRPIPWGSIELGAAYTFAITKRNGTRDSIPVVGEQHVLTSAEATFMEHENVDTDTILVTDVTGSIVYIENVDYRIQIVGTDTRVSRIPLGAITDGQTVRISYSYHIDTAYDDSSFGQDYSVDLHLWSVLYLTYTHRRLKQSVLSADPPFLSEGLSGVGLDDTVDSVQVRLDTKWSETRFLYENEDRSNGNSRETKSIRERISLRPYEHFSLNFSGYYGNRRFKENSDRETFYTLGADIGWTPKWWCYLNLIGTHNSISGALQDTVFTELTAAARLSYGIWSCRLTYKLIDENDEAYGSSRWAQRIYFVINRSLW